jgi:DNA-binding LacI/PurR family transcriptional regulator
VPDVKQPVSQSRRGRGDKTAAAASSTRRRRAADISITDVAHRAGVSIGTVSRVFNQHPNVAADLRRRVLVASRALRFVPKVPHRCIGVVTGRMSPALPTGYVSVMTSLISRYLAARQYAVELIDVENLDLAYQAHVEGVIGVVFDQRILQLREIPNLPLMTVNNPMVADGVHSIRADHYQQAVLATEHFIRCGHRRIGLLQIEPDEWGSRERLRGYRDALAAAGIEEDPQWAQYTIQQPVYEVVSRWLRRGVTGILNFSEDTSLEVLHFLSNILKLRIGQDVSTISLEDLPIYQYFTPPQTTVRQPLEQLAQLAVDRMLALCEAARSRQEPGELVDACVTSELIERDSVACLAPSAPEQRIAPVATAAAPQPPVVTAEPTAN